MVAVHQENWRFVDFSIWSRYSSVVSAGNWQEAANQVIPRQEPAIFRVCSVFHYDLILMFFFSVFMMPRRSGKGIQGLLQRSHLLFFIPLGCWCNFLLWQLMTVWSFWNYYFFSCSSILQYLRRRVALRLSQAAKYDKFVRLIHIQ